jgi:hypothetical protein
MAPTIKQDPTAEVAPEILAQAIEDVAAAAKKLLASRLSKRAIILLIHDHAAGRVGKREIEQVLDSAASLTFYLNKK